MSNKGERRRQVRQAITQTTATDRAAWSRAICEALWAWPGLHEGGCVGVYLADATEPDLDPLIERLIAAGVPVAGPRIDWDAHTMVWRRLGGLGTLEVRRHGIREAPASGKAVPASELGVLMVPGVAFDLSGGRLGRGGGFYDRYLAGAAASGVRTVGVCFSRQIVGRVPMDTHDVAVRMLVTEDGLLAASNETTEEHG